MAKSTELYDSLLQVILKSRNISTSELKTAQDAMINLRVDWEDLQSCLKSRSVDGFEPVISKMIALSATALVMAAALMTKLNEQKVMLDKLIEEEDKDPHDLTPTIIPVKQPKKRGPKAKVSVQLN